MGCNSQDLVKVLKKEPTPPPVTSIPSEYQMALL